jgi:hypothetical protein
MYYDDNFGEWDMSDEGSVEFYHQVQRASIRKTCKGCGKVVKIMPQYAYCDRCADARESGDLLMGWE